MKLVLALKRFQTTKTATVSQAPTKLKRFWKTAGIQEQNLGYQILLDNRTLKTSGGISVVIPKERKTLAILTAAEWETQGEFLKSYSLPLTSIVMRAVDSFSNDETRQATIDTLLNFVHTDSICYQQEYPESLTKLQQEYWLPIIKWAEKLVGDEIKTTESILSIKQSEKVIQGFRDIISNYDNFKLAAFENAVLRSKSFMIGLALVEGEVSSEFGTMAARLEVHHQIQRWGEVEDSHDIEREDIHRQLASSSVALIQ